MTVLKLHTKLIRGSHNNFWGIAKTYEKIWNLNIPAILVVGPMEKAFKKLVRFLYLFCVLARINRGCFLPLEKIHMNVNIDNQTIWSFKLKVMLVRHVRYGLISNYAESEIVKERAGKFLHHYGVFFSSLSSLKR